MSNRQLPETVTHLLDLRERVRKDWGKFTFDRCLYGQVNIIFTGDCTPQTFWSRSPQHRAVLRALGNSIPGWMALINPVMCLICGCSGIGWHVLKIMSFNDRKRTNKGKVLEVIDHAIAMEMSKTKANMVSQSELLSVG